MRHTFAAGITAFALTLSGCSTQLIGSSADRPAALMQINVTSENPGNRTTVTVERTLKEHRIQLNPNAPLILSLKNISYTHPLPDQINAGVAFVTTATLTIRYELTTNKGVIVVSDRTIAASQNLLHNANQVNTASMDSIFLRSLSQQLANSIYYQLSATNTVKLINKVLGKSDAVERK